MTGRITARFGNRGVALAMLGVLWLFTAVGVAVAPLRRTTLLDERLPVWLRVCLWGLPGLLALAAAIWRRFDTDAWGWLIVPAAIRFTSFLFGWLCSLIGWHAFAYPDGWRGATTIAVFVVFIKTCAAGLDRPAPANREA
jgi:hypothetical protein